MNTDSEGIGKVICSKCNGKGEVGKEWLCSKCQGEGKLDWIENVVGKSGFYIRPGVYTKEVDLSYFLPKTLGDIWYAPPGFDRSKS